MHKHRCIDTQRTHVHTHVHRHTNKKTMNGQQPALSVQFHCSVFSLKKKEVKHKGGNVMQIYKMKLNAKTDAKSKN